MSIEITTMVENKIGEHLGLKCEHGISFFIKKDNTSIIFDTGQSNAFMKNAEKLSIDLSEVQHIVLSHGHYDHTGGFKEFVKNFGSNFKFHIKDGFFCKKYGCNGLSYEYLGNDFDKQYLLDNNIEVEYVKNNIEEIAEGIFIFSNFERECVYERVNPRFYINKEGKYKIDTFNDEIVIAVETKNGLVVILGCSHPGVINILNTIIKRTGKPIYGIIGGTHLVEADSKRLVHTLEYFEQKNIQLLGISHCTGAAAVEELKKYEGKFFYNGTGTSIIVD